MHNLDLLAFRRANELIETIIKIDKNKAENSFQKTLGVLQENGLFGFYVFVSSKRDDSAYGIIYDAIVECSTELIGEIYPQTKESTPEKEKYKKLEKMISERSNNIDEVYFTKNMIEKMLTYARYLAKAYMKKVK
ncbi:MAG TPA: hypothetical protein PK581_08325 [Caldisericia bacterium]|nr:hypothetical protein [Caldisericia bacterium]